MQHQRSLYPFLIFTRPSLTFTVCFGIDDCKTYEFDCYAEKEFVQQGIDTMLRDFRRDITKKTNLPYIERTFDYSFTVIYPDGDVKLYGFDSPEERKFVQGGIIDILDELHFALDDPSRTFIPTDPWPAMKTWLRNSSEKKIRIPIF